VSRDANKDADALIAKPVADVRERLFRVTGENKR